MAQLNIRHGSIRPQVINAIFDSSSPFTVNEIAESRGLLYKSVKRVVDQLVTEGYITKTPSALRPMRPDGKFDRGRPKDAFYLVANHAKIRELRASVPRDNLPVIEDDEPVEPTSFYYDRAKKNIDLMEKSGAIKADLIESIGDDLELAKNEESLNQKEPNPLKKAFIQYQKGRLNYANGSINSALRNYISSALLFKKFNVTDMISRCSHNIFKCQVDLFEEYQKKIADITEDQNLLAKYFEEAEEVCHLSIEDLQKSKSEEVFVKFEPFQEKAENLYNSSQLETTQTFDGLKLIEPPQYIKAGQVIKVSQVFSAGQTIEVANFVGAGKEAMLLCMNEERIDEVVRNINKTRKQMVRLEKSLFTLKQTFELFFRDDMPRVFVHRFKR